MPRSLANLLGISLAVLEIAIAALLLPVQTTWWGALGALVLMLAFMAVIGVNLAQGRKPECHCFGRFRSEPAGWRTLARNSLLAALAAFLIWQGAEHSSPSMVAWIAVLTPWQAAAVLAGTAGAIVIAAQGWFLLQLFHQHGRLLLRLTPSRVR